MPLAAVGGVPLLAGLAGAGELRRRLRVAQRGDRRVLRPQAPVQVGHEHIRAGAAPRPTELVPDPAALSQPEELRVRVALIPSRPFGSPRLIAAHFPRFQIARKPSTNRLPLAGSRATPRPCSPIGTAATPNASWRVDLPRLPPAQHLQGVPVSAAGHGVETPPPNPYRRLNRWAYKLGFGGHFH